MDDSGGEACTGSPSHLLPSPVSSWNGGAEGAALSQHLMRQSTPWAPVGSSGRAAPHQQPFALFDGLPLTPAALKASRWQADRDAVHAGQHERGSLGTPPPQQAQQQQAQQQQAQQQQAPTPSPCPAVAGPSNVAGGAAAEQHRLPRSPIGLDIRHTKKSAAAAAGRASASAGAALQRLKSARQSPALVASPAAVTVQLSPVSQQAQVQEAEQQGARQQHSQQQQRDQQHHQQPAPQQNQQQQKKQQLYAHAEQQTQTEATPQQDAAPLQPPRLLQDSNAALVLEVRDLSSRLLASLLKHAPEASDIAGSPHTGSCSRSGVSTAPPFPLHQRLDMEGEVSSLGAGSWRLSAVPAASASSLAAAVSPVAFSWAGASSSAAISGRKFRLSDFGSSSSSAGAGEASGMLSPGLSTLGGGGDVTPTSLSSGMASLAQFSSLDLSGSLSPGPLKPFSIDSFRQQTEALRRQLAAGI